MPVLHVNGVDLHYESTGRGTEVVLFSHGLLWSTRQFDPQVAALSDRYRCVAWDHRGQGRSAAPDELRIDVDVLYDDAVALITALSLGPVHFVGLSMGGFVGLRLAARRPDLVRTLTLMSTAADPEPPSRRRELAALSLAARTVGLPLALGPVAKRMFGKTFLGDPERAEERRALARQLRANSPSIARLLDGLRRRPGVEAELSAIRAPTLVLIGGEDRALAESRVIAMQQAIAGAIVTRIPEAGHAMTIEQPDAVNAALSAFLARHPERVADRVSAEEGSRVQGVT